MHNVDVRYFGLILRKTRTYGHISLKRKNIKFHEDQFNIFLVVSCMQTEREILIGSLKVFIGTKNAIQVTNCYPKWLIKFVTL